VLHWAQHESQGTESAEAAIQNRKEDLDMLCIGRNMITKE
jgi:hypothetical protein